jgi:AraC-like DNA-binding protein
VLSIRIDHGRAWFPWPRDYCGITIPLVSGFEASLGGNTLEFEPGSACVAEGEGDSIQPQPGSHLLGVNIDSALLESHREALEACWGSRPRPSNRVVRTTTSAGRNMLGYVDWVWRELVQPDSPLHTPRVTREVDDTMARLLAEAIAAPEFDDGVIPDEAVTRRAEELFAAQLDQPISIAEVAKAVGVSTRTLSRAFQRRYGMGPATFRRRRRLEGARRDLIDGEPGEVKVIDVALRFGFFHLGRFSVEYRRSFGESPSDTLRS